jgi:hypothetical protein
MTRNDDLQKLLALRATRLQRAENELAHQHRLCEAAQAQAAAATARVLSHRRRQENKERALLEGLIGRPVTVKDIERVRTAFAILEQQSLDFERSERDAGVAVRAANEAKAGMMLDRNRRRREKEKMLDIVAQLARAADRTGELRLEVDQEERIPSRSIWVQR